MAFVATNASDSSRMRRAFGIGGGLKIQLMTWTAASGDTSGTVIADQLVEVTGIMIDGVEQTAAATFSGNVATLAFRDPSTTGAVAGDLIVFGV
jgi:hypothetical protein